MTSAIVSKMFKFSEHLFVEKGFKFKTKKDIILCTFDTLLQIRTFFQCIRN